MRVHPESMAQLPQASGKDEPRSLRQPERILKAKIRMTANEATMTVKITYRIQSGFTKHDCLLGLSFGVSALR